MFANIGKGVLYQLIGIQDNYKKTILTVDNITAASPCSKCPWLKAALANPDAQAGYNLLKQRCCSCGDRCFKMEDIKITTSYIYEGRYGAKPRLNQNAVLVFMLLHLQSPDISGFISGVKLSMLADMLHVHERTIRNNLVNLKKSGYIYYDLCPDNTINVILLDYSSYYASAREGGAGYIKISDSIIDELTNISSVVLFRIIMREYLETDRRTETTKSYKEILHYLPKYCRRSIIDDKLKEHQKVFNICKKLKAITFTLSPKFDLNLQLNIERANYTKHYTELLDKLDDFVLSRYRITSKTVIPEELTRFFSYNGVLVQTPRFFLRNGADVPETLAKIACKYGQKAVDNALADTYRIQMCTKQELIQNIGAYILTVIKNNINDAYKVSLLNQDINELELLAV